MAGDTAVLTAKVRLESNDTVFVLTTVLMSNIGASPVCFFPQLKCAENNKTEDLSFKCVILQDFPTGHTKDGLSRDIHPSR